jgi:hypothetical protein
MKISPLKTLYLIKSVLFVLYQCLPSQGVHTIASYIADRILGRITEAAILSINKNWIFSLFLPRESLVVQGTST